MDKLKQWLVGVSLGLLVSLAVIVWLCFKSMTTPHEYFCPDIYDSVSLENDENEEVPLEQTKHYRTLKLAFFVPVYNVDLSMFKKRVEYWTRGCDSYKLFLYGLDSSWTLTLRQLKWWRAHDPKHVVLVKPFPRSQKPENRQERIALVRQCLLDAGTAEMKKEKKKHGKKFKPFDLAIVYDGDLLGPMSKSGLIDAAFYLKQNPSILGVAASGCVRVLPSLDLMYDSAAYRDTEGGSKSMWWFWHYYVPFAEEYRPAKSAFNGASMYRWHEYKKARYYPALPDVCEHVLLNSDIEDGHEERTMVISKKWQLLCGLSQKHVYRTDW